MREITIYTQASESEIVAALSRIPEVVQGGGQFANAMLVSVGLTLLGRIRTAFIAKARGGTDEAGDRWQPLSPMTIALRRKGPTRRRDQSDANPRAVVGGYDKYANWQVEILRDTGLLLSSLSPGVADTSDGTDPIHAQGSSPPAIPNQVFRLGRGEVIVGTNRAGAAKHHAGIPGKLPQRRLWPLVSDWPTPWWDDILDTARAGIVNIAVDLVENL